MRRTVTSHNTTSSASKKLYEPCLKFKVSSYSTWNWWINDWLWETCWQSIIKTVIQKKTFRRQPMNELVGDLVESEISIEYGEHGGPV